MLDRKNEMNNVVVAQFVCFLYHIVCVCQVVWSAATAPTSNEAFDITAESSIQFNIVIINLGEVWSPTRIAATIAVPGIYYTVVTMGISCVQPTVFWLRVNNKNVFKIIPSVGILQTHNNGAVIRLDVGDILNVTIELPLSAKYYCTSSNVSSAFFGILLSQGN
jgi:hypothetical protein